MLKNHLKIAFRNLMASKLFTGLNIIGLTGGMVAAVFILLWVQNELSFDAYHQKSDKISRIITHLQVSKEETWHWSNTPLPLTNELSKLPEVEMVTRKNSIGSLSLRVGDRKVNAENVIYADSNWFRVFDYQFVEGSASDFSATVRNIAMTEAKALQLFNTSHALGEIVRIDLLDYTVSAIYKANPANSSFQYDFIIPIAAYWANPKIFENDNNWNQFNYETYTVLKKNTNRNEFGKKLTKVISGAKLDDNGKPSTNITLEVEPLTQMHFNNQIQGASQHVGDKRTIYIFFGLALVILLVACINYVNLTTARASVRSKEIGVKKLLGAGSSHLFGQFMTESVLTCFAAFLLAFLSVYLLIPVFNSLTGRTFEFFLSNASLWYVLVGTTFTAILLTGVYPSLLLSSFKPFDILRGNNVLGSTNGGFRKALVVVQFTVAVVFLISTLVVFQQMKFVREKELGYDRAHTFTFRIPWSLKAKVAPVTMKSRLLTESSIADVTVASQSIVQIGSSTTGSYDWNGRPKDFNPTVSQIAVEDNFHKLFDVKIKEGRWFEPNSITDQSNVVLNETAVRKLNLPKPVIGQRFDFQGKKGVVIGIVRDFHFKSLREKIEPLVLFNNTEWSLGLYVKALPGKEAEAIRAVERVWNEMIPDYALDYSFLDDTYDRLYKSEQRTAVLFNAFAAIAVLISCLGLFGLATFTAERRLKEVGIRKVLGASVAAIVTLLSTDFLILVLIAIVIASPIGFYFMSSWLKGFEYKIELNWIIFAVAGFCAVLVALFTISYQSIRAALMNPVKSLKNE
ncbi:ABC transporter permease [Dyadobacter luteus]|uniref:ABC transporter permease n=1 Tax=Dyadobacter luteus TaxID=2259619 RepID=A0A3D8Y6M5_9BACT|nr:ABC transporter permease [Dyadobacter luteus]REA57888.1 ABC transporter permease [Dyadobacter luteus]